MIPKSGTIHWITSGWGPGMWAQQEQRSHGRIVSGVGSWRALAVNAKGLERGGPLFSARPRQRACQDPLTRQGGDALMRVCSFKWMQWIGLASSTFGETWKTKGYLHSIDTFFFVCYKSRLHFDNSNISFFSHLLCNPKLRWHFRIKCTCRLTFISVYETSRDTLNLKLNIIWNLSNIHTGFCPEGSNV